ncbi:TetR/AcrR family transcriptional regulator [Haloarchaeobius sp. DFWS5]|uniref:TetR/AcrR family transcriptional regulator n=1 Tax=Haloarchaeobius sp. DFWS5 TaxID=3446114 RepID=UPI003EBB689A
MGGSPKPVVESAIMEATRGALAAHGYTELSFTSVTDNCEYGRGVLDMYYEDTADLVAAFLEYESDRFAEFVMLAPERPDLRLRVMLEALVGLDTLEADGLLQPYLELYVHALSNERIQEGLDALQTEMYDSLVATITKGIETGLFTDVDPYRTASAIFAVHESALRQEAFGREAGELRDALDHFVLSQLRPE